MPLFVDSVLLYISVKLIVFLSWFQITKLLAVKSEDVLAQSPLSKLRGSQCWKLPKGVNSRLKYIVLFDMFKIF